MRLRFAAPLVLSLALVATNALAAGVDPTTATPAQKQEAQAHFGKAHDLFDAKKFPEALGEYKASWEIVASPNARLFIARCLREMGNLAHAYDEYQATIDDAKALAPKEPRYAETAKAADSEGTALESQVGFVTVQIEHPSDDTTVMLGGTALEKARWFKPVAVDPGTIDVAVQVGGKDVAHESVAVVGGDKKTVSLDAHPPAKAVAVAPPPAPEPEKKTAKVEVVPTVPSGRSSLRTYAYVAGGVGVVGLVTFGVFGAMEKSTYSDLQSACPNNVCPPGKSDDINTGKTQQLIANIGLGVGIAGLAVGTTLFVLSLPHSSTSSSSASTAGNTALVVSPNFIGVRGAM